MKTYIFLKDTSQKFTGELNHVSKIPDFPVLYARYHPHLTTCCRLDFIFQATFGLSFRCFLAGEFGSVDIHGT